MPNGKPTKRARRRRKAKKLNNLKPVMRIKFKDTFLKHNIANPSSERAQKLDVVLHENASQKKEFGKEHESGEQTCTTFAIVYPDKMCDDVILLERRQPSDEMEEKDLVECIKPSTETKKLNNSMDLNNFNAEEITFHSFPCSDVLNDESLISKEKFNVSSPCEKVIVDQEGQSLDCYVNNSMEISTKPEDKHTSCALKSFSEIRIAQINPKNDNFVPEEPVVKEESRQTIKRAVDIAEESNLYESSIEVLSSRIVQAFNGENDSEFVTTRKSPLLLEKKESIDAPPNKLINDRQNGECVRDGASNPILSYSSNLFGSDGIVGKDGVEVFSNFSDCDGNAEGYKNYFKVHRNLLRTGNVNWLFVLILSCVLELVKWISDQSLLSLRRLCSFVGLGPLETETQHCICCTQHRDSKLLQRLDIIEKEIEELKRGMLRQTRICTVENLESKVQCSHPPPPPPPPPPPMPLFHINTPVVIKKANTEKQKNGTSSIRPSITVEDLQKVQLRKTPAAPKMDRCVSTPNGPIISLEMLRSVKLKSCIQRKKSWDRKKSGRDENGLRMKSPSQSPRENPFTWVLRKKESHARLRGRNSLSTRVGNHFKEAISNEI